MSKVGARTGRFQLQDAIELDEVLSMMLGQVSGVLHTLLQRAEDRVVTHLRETRDGTIWQGYQGRGTQPEDVTHVQGELRRAWHQGGGFAFSELCLAVETRDGDWATAGGILLRSFILDHLPARNAALARRRNKERMQILRALEGIEPIGAAHQAPPELRTWMKQLQLETLRDKQIREYARSSKTTGAPLRRGTLFAVYIDEFLAELQVPGAMRHKLIAGCLTSFFERSDMHAESVRVMLKSFRDREERRRSGLN